MLLFSDLLNQKYKNTLLRFILIYFFAFDLSIYYKFTSRPLPTLRRHTPKGTDNPFNTSGCEWLLFVCRGGLRCVAWFSYWFDNLGFISKGNTYCRCAASSLPLWGNTDVASSDIKRNFWRRCRGGSSQDSLLATCQFLALLPGRHHLTSPISPTYIHMWEGAPSTTTTIA